MFTYLWFFSAYVTQVNAYVIPELVRGTRSIQIKNNSILLHDIDASTMHSKRNGIMSRISGLHESLWSLMIHETWCQLHQLDLGLKHPVHQVMQRKLIVWSASLIQSRSKSLNLRKRLTFAHWLQKHDEFFVFKRNLVSIWLCGCWWVRASMVFWNLFLINIV